MPGLSKVALLELAEVISPVVEMRLEDLWFDLDQIVTFFFSFPSDFVFYLIPTNKIQKGKYIIVNMETEYKNMNDVF